MAAKKQELSEYVPDAVWSEPVSAEGSMGGMNKPTAGARFERKLPVGKHPLQLYSLGTPNGKKVTTLLEELYDAKGVEYDAWTINIMKLDQFGDEFVAINPNSKIPALRDMDGPDGKPIEVFESASILLYLAEKFDMFIPIDPRKRVECMNWLFWLQGSAPYIGGGFGHFYKYAPIKIEYAINRYSMETKRILDVLEKHLSKDGGRSYVCGDEISIADFNIVPWVACVWEGYNAKEYLSVEADYPNVMKYVERVQSRPAVKRGNRVNGWGADAVSERHSIADFDPKPAVEADKEEEEKK